MLADLGNGEEVVEVASIMAENDGNTGFDITEREVIVSLQNTFALAERVGISPVLYRFLVSQ